MTGFSSAGFHNGQIAGQSTADQDHYSGMAEGPLVHYQHWLSSSDQLMAVENALELGADVFHHSKNPPDGTACDNIPWTTDLGSAIYYAQQDEMIVVHGTADSHHTGGCNLNGIQESPSVLVVGEVGNEDSPCDDTNYGTSSCDIAVESALGGMDATINGGTVPGALSLVSLVAPGYMGYCIGAGSDSDFHNPTNNGGCGHGVSFANPQVAGAGIMVKDYMLANGFTGIQDEGRLSVVLQAMGDRAYSSTGYNVDGYSNLWGGGRFQLRNLANLGAPWYWSTGSHVMSNHDVVDSDVGDSGNEPSGLGQFKAYAMVFEESATDIANFQLDIYNHNCTDSGATSLRSDVSADVHKMVQIGSAGANQALCTKLYAYYVPSGQTRKVHMFRYYSGPTTMR